MRVTNPTSGDPRSQGRLPDDLDGLLRAYYRSEMPESWPAFQPPPLPAQRRRTLVASRLALAASIVVLLLGQLWLLGSFRGSGAAAPELGGQGVANRPGPRPPLHKSKAGLDKPDQAQPPGAGQDWPDRDDRSLRSRRGTR